MNMFDLVARHMLAFVLFAIAVFLIWLVTIIDIVKSDFKKDVDKIVWFLFVMLVPLLGALLYFLIGQLQKDYSAPSTRRSTRYKDIGRE
jgi:hypothetical protein